MFTLRLTTTLALVIAAPLASASSRIRFDELRNTPQTLKFGNTYYRLTDVTTSGHGLTKTAVVKSRYTRKEYALTVKQVTGETKSKIQSEVAVMSALLNVDKKEHVVHVKYAKERYDTAVFLTEKSTMGSLNGKHMYDAFEALDFLSEMTQGLSTLAKRNIMHRDLKLENIMVTDNKYKIFNFASATTRQSSTELIGDVKYMAPEVLQQQHAYDAKVDIFSLGVLTSEMILGVNPFVKVNGRTARGFNELSRNRQSYFKNKNCLDTPATNGLIPFGLDLNALICKMTAKSPSQRITLNELMKEIEEIERNNIGLERGIHHRSNQPQEPFMQQQSSSGNSFEDGEWNQPQEHPSNLADSGDDQPSMNFRPLGNTNLSYYEFFNVPSNASQQEIRQAYDALKRLYVRYVYHDRTTFESANAQADTAYRTLSNPASRASYDRYLLNSWRF